MAHLIRRFCVRSRLLRRHQNRPRVSRVLQTSSIARFSSPGFLDRVTGELRGIKDSGLWKPERILTTHQKSEILTEGTGDKPLLNFCANNYLGLSDSPDLLKAAKAGLDSHGFGLSSVRFICGTQDIHKTLERKIAEFHGMEDAILYASCFDANAGIFEALLSKEDAILTDKLNHASIIDGVRLCKAQRYVFNHMDMAHLEECLHDATHTKRVRNKIIVTDGCFSMDGDVAPLKEIVDLANKYDSLLLVDDSHSTGFMGKTGRGTDEHCGVKVDMINSTMGKALGGATGGYTVGPKCLIDMLRQRSRPYLFSNSLAPSLVAATISVFDSIMHDNRLRDKLASNTQRFRQRMGDEGFTLMGDPMHPIAPVMLRDAKLAQVFAEDMLGYGIYVIGFSYPVVPQNEARIRVQISAGHEFDQIDRAVDAFVAVAKKHGVLS